MPRKYGISTLKYPENFWHLTPLGASCASPGLGRLRR